MKRYIITLMRRLCPTTTSKLQSGYAIWNNFYYDARRFLMYGGMRNQGDRATLEALITMDYHRLEKGLSLHKPRADFGASAASNLLENLAYYCSNFGADSTVAVSISVLREYVEFRRENMQETNSLDASVEKLAAKYLNSMSIADGGTRELTGAQVKKLAALGGKSFFESRHSIRNFSNEPVTTQNIRDAVEIAKSTPSVCNRQSWHVHAVFDDALKARILDVQNGNRGFRTQISSVLVVTCDLRKFVSIGERNQAWVDGGMFSMSLIYALHTLGLGSCCLNWSAPKWRDVELRKRLPLKPYEAVIMMIAVGNIPERFKIACSRRRETNEILTVHADH